MADQLGQRDVTIVFDQSIYAKALEIVWQGKIYLLFYLRTKPRDMQW